MLESKERRALEVSPSDTVHVSQGAAEVTRATARGDGAQEVGSTGADHGRRQKKQIKSIE